MPVGPTSATTGTRWTVDPGLILKTQLVMETRLLFETQLVLEVLQYRYLHNSTALHSADWVRVRVGFRVND